MGQAPKDGDSMSMDAMKHSVVHTCAGGAEAVAPRAAKRPSTFRRFGHMVRPRCHRYCVVHMIRKALNQKKVKDSKAGE
jgi:hypothetical protein